METGQGMRISGNGQKPAPESAKICHLAGRDATGDRGIQDGKKDTP